MFEHAVTDIASIYEYQYLLAVFLNAITAIAVVVAVTLPN